MLEKSPNSQTPTLLQGVTICLSKFPCRQRPQTLTVTPAPHRLKGGYQKREGLATKGFFVCSLIIRNVGLDRKDALTTHHAAGTWSLGRFSIATSSVQRGGFARGSTVSGGENGNRDLWAVGQRPQTLTVSANPSREARREGNLGGGLPQISLAGK